jgi:hypothetical protein
MNPESIAAAIAVSLSAGKTNAQIIAEAARRAFQAYREGKP